MDLFELLFPKKCVGCGARGRYICERCTRKVGVRGESLRYEGVVRQIIKEIKYRGTYDMVQALVDVWLDHNHVDQLRQGEGWIITAVPMYSPKKKKRGFNQAELIAKCLAEKWGMEYRELLVRTRPTKPMYGLSPSARAANIRGAFAAINRDRYERVILVDDVWTTGVTMRECRKILMRAGVSEVRMFAIAR